ncbi:MAG TPA: prepilin-type N-terminal cleavage/methylation domain-containing protein, partial [Desulfatiglandales bacterium]|nr:prepilin-type N-terminal cleavage/methylation domain-containing protein [Desulfatiglandales bacterium]
VNPKGFTLVEVIIFIVVAGIVASTIFIPLMTGLKGGMGPDHAITASYLAQAKMEEFTKYKYSNSNLDAVSLTAYAQVHATYFPGYDWQWEIKYIGEGLTDYCCDVGYKQIRVKVRDPDGQEIEVISVVTNFFWLS